jgi:hypothetical protein
MPAGLQTLRRYLPGKKLERCDLCGVALPADHTHLLEIESRRMVCACQACGILFEHRGASHYRRVGRDVRALPGFEITDTEWASLLVPIGLAFFTYNTPLGRVQAMYPGPAGATESLLLLSSWSVIAARNPVLQKMEPDVEALLVNRVGGAREYYLAPIDRCYELVGIIRMNWHGLSGGDPAWQEIGRFFGRLKEHSRA